MPVTFHTCGVRLEPAIQCTIKTEFSTVHTVHSVTRNSVLSVNARAAKLVQYALQHQHRNRHPEPQQQRNERQREHGASEAGDPLLEVREEYHKHY